MDVRLAERFEAQHRKTEVRDDIGEALAVILAEPVRFPARDPESGPAHLDQHFADRIKRSSRIRPSGADLVEPVNEQGLSAELVRYRFVQQEVPRRNEQASSPSAWLSSWNAVVLPDPGSPSSTYACTDR